MWRNLDELVSDIRKKAIDIGAAELAIVQQVTLISKVLLELEMQHGYSYSDIMKDYKKRTLEETVVWLKGLYQKLTLEIKGRSNYRHYKLITELKYYIDQHLQDDISLEMLAEKAELSPSYLSSLFKEMLHLSFSEYLNEARIKNEAKRLLEDRSVDEPVIAIMFILRMGSLLDAGFDQVLNLYNPAVYRVSDIIDTYVFRVGILRKHLRFKKTVRTRR